MNKKGALELSVNAIVILIIALTILGLVLGFAVSKFRELSGELTLSEDTPEATPQIPIQFPGGKGEITLAKGKSTKMGMRIYNSGVADIDMATARYTLSCAGPDSAVAASNTAAPATGKKIGYLAVGTIAAGSIGPSSAIVSVSGDVPTGSYACLLDINGISRTVTCNII